MELANCCGSGCHPQWPINTFRCSWRHLRVDSNLLKAMQMNVYLISIIGNIKPDFLCPKLSICLALLTTPPPEVFSHQLLQALPRSPNRTERLLHFSFTSKFRSVEAACWVGGGNPSCQAHWSCVAGRVEEETKFCWVLISCWCRKVSLDLTLE